MKRSIRFFMLSLVLIAATAAQLSAQTAASATYSITFTRLWTGTTHPFEYPESTIISGPNLSGLIGATHAQGFSLFREGAKPTPGLERLSEEGKHSPLDEEIKRAIASGKAGALFETGPIRDEMGSETATVTVTTKFPFASAVAMIAPSPDWFAGVSNVNLMEGGKWVAKKSVDLYAYDSGGDDGTTYKASDADTNPKKATMMASTRHFAGNKKPIARITFTKM
jgi:hypothetical protein